MIEEILGEEDIPIKLDLNLEKKMLNMMQYRYEYDKYFWKSVIVDRVNDRHI